MPSLLEFEFEIAHVLLAAVGLFSLIFSTFSRELKERLYLNEPALALCVGALVERAVEGKLFERRLGLTVMEAGTAQDIVREVTRAIIGIQVFTSSLELPHSFVFASGNWKALAMLLGPVLLGSWAISFLLIHFITRLSPLPALAAAAAVVPTDPVLIHAIVKGAFAEYEIPARVRSTLSAESAANDGLGLPLLFFPLVLSMSDHSASWQAAKFLGVVICWETIAGLLFGALLGLVCGRLLAWSLKHALMEHDSLQAYAYVLSIGTLGTAELLEMNGIVASFAAGLFFAAGLKHKTRLEELQLQESVDLLAGNIFFLLLGATVPWGLWFDQLNWWQWLVLPLSLFFLKRLPLLLAFYRFCPLNIYSWSEAVHMGWFGPTGAAAFLYGLEILRRGGRFTDQQDASTAYLIVTWVIVISVLLHGITSVPLTKWLARMMIRDLNDPQEHDMTFEHWDLEDWQQEVDGAPDSSRGSEYNEGPPQAPPPPGLLLSPVTRKRRLARKKKLLRLARRRPPEQQQHRAQGTAHREAQEQQHDHPEREAQPVPAWMECLPQKVRSALQNLWTFVFPFPDLVSRGWRTKRERRRERRREQVAGRELPV